MSSNSPFNKRVLRKTEVKFEHEVAGGKKVVRAQQREDKVLGQRREEQKERLVEALSSILFTDSPDDETIMYVARNIGQFETVIEHSSRGQIGLISIKGSKERI